MHGFSNSVSVGYARPMPSTNNTVWRPEGHRLYSSVPLLPFNYQCRFWHHVQHDWHVLHLQCTSVYSLQVYDQRMRCGQQALAILSRSLLPCDLRLQRRFKLIDHGRHISIAGAGKQPDFCMLNLPTGFRISGFCVAKGHRQR